MNPSILQRAREALTDGSTFPGARLVRGVTAAAEPVYSSVMSLRNRAYDRGWKKSHPLGRFTVSVGNITTGGTGKTPVVVWLAKRLTEQGHRPAVLMRGYAADTGIEGDEQRVYRRALPGVAVVANPSRVGGAVGALSADPAIDCFLLDDGFQHRRARRHLDLVLINATDPFGGGHVLPRGLLREPMTGLARADTLVVTRSSLVEVDRLTAIKIALRKYAPATPILHCDHAIIVPTWLAGQSVLSVCGIGDPASFEQQLRAAGIDVAESIRFEDHHNYKRSDVDRVHGRAAGRNIVTTRKDWVKIEASLSDAERPRWHPVDLEIRFRDDDGERLLTQIVGAEKRLHGGGFGPVQPGGGGNEA